jgi:hypothetical protein
LDFEALRQRYRPDEVRVLVVGESRPAGGTFFYAGDSLLFKATRSAFVEVYEYDWAEPAAFLEFFKERGFFLIDLCPEPVNKLDEAAREEARELGMPALARTVAASAPRVVVGIMVAIMPYVRRAVEEAGRGRAGLPIPILQLPFPRNEHRARYVRELGTFLREFQ